MTLIQIKGKYAWLKHLDFMVIDLLSMLLAFALMYRFKFGNFSFTRSDTWMRFILIVSLLNLIISLFVNPYSGIFRRSYYKEIKKTLLLTFYNLVLSIVIFYLFKVGDTYSRELTVGMYGAFFCISLLFKYIWKKLLVSGKIVIYSTKMIPLFIIGRQGKIKKVIRNVCAGDFQLYDVKGVHLIKKNQDAQRNQQQKQDKHSMVVAADENSRIEAATVDNDASNNKGTGGSYGSDSANDAYNKKRKIRLSSIIDTDNSKDDTLIDIVDNDYVDYILGNNIMEVLIAVDPASIPSEIYERLISNGIGVNMVIENMVGFQTEDQFVQNIGIYKTMSFSHFSFTPGQMMYMVFKRFIDIVCSFIGILFLIPIAIFIKLAYVVGKDFAPIFYRHERVGMNGKLIKIWKFRSMVPNADKMLAELLKTNREYKRQWDKNQKIDDDPRITKIGRVLRSTSIDELPQLINVFMGDMSLVGPRPLVFNELESHNGLKLYQKVRPGITGWWGCNGRSNIDYRERLELEYYYIKNCSLYLDLLCVLRTIFAVMKKDGAR